VFVRDVKAGVRHEVGRPGARVSQSEFNPALAAGGSAIAYQAVRPSGHSQVLVTLWPSRRSVLVSRRGRSGPAANADTYEPSISADGDRIAFTTAASNLGATGGRSQVFVRDRPRGTTVLASRGHRVASGPAIAGDGRSVAFVAGRAVYLRDLQRRRTVRVSSPADGAALAPAVSATGRYVAYTAIADDGRTTVLLRDVHRRATAVIARDAEDPSISANGRRVAFSSTATNLAAGKPDDRRGVFVRDIRAGTTQLVSALVPLPGGGPTPPLAPPLKAVATAAPLGPHQIAINDNAFHHGRDRPVVQLNAGQRLTWLWRSRQSHEVTVYRGPSVVHSPTQSYGRYSVRLTRPGTYEFVCAIHAPGMRMTAVVR
jgi:Tol biopolymer transport system component/plastocyanin